MRRPTQMRQGIIYLGIYHIVGNLSGFRLAANDMEPCCNFNGSVAGLRRS